MCSKESYSEPTALADIFVSGIGDIERVGSCARFPLYVEKHGEREIVASIMIPLDALPTAIDKASCFLANSVRTRIVEGIRRLVN